MAESFTIVHPVTGEPLPASATLNNAYMIIAHQIFTTSYSKGRAQHTAFLKDPYVLNAQSYAIAVAMKTNAQATNTSKGQVHKVDVLGNPDKGGRAKTT